MLSALVSKLVGLSLGKAQMESSELALLKCDNFILNRELFTARKRGGTAVSTTTGDYWGIGSYSKDSGNLKTPIFSIPVRHRRSGSTSYIEKYDWSAGTWSAITQGANTSFGIGAVASFAQIDNLLTVMADRPAMITDIDSGNINRLGGPAPTAAPSVSTTGTGLTGTYYYLYTFYDSATGWESSPSPVSAVINPSNQSVSVSSLETTVAKEGVDKKRIYRTQSTGAEPFYLVTTVTLATTSYTDSTADASLGVESPDTGDNDPPPTSAYICAAYANRLWIATGTDLYWSKEFDGNLYRLEQFSSERVISFNQIITGLAPAPRYGGLLVFKAAGYGIDIIKGTNDSDFEREDFYPSEGTNYHSSISVKDDQIVYWGRRGPRLISNGQMVTEFDEQIHNMLRPYIVQEYNQDMFIWSVWHEDLGQFVFGFGAVNTTGALWIESGTGIAVSWIDSSTGAEVGWQV